MGGGVVKVRILKRIWQKNASRQEDAQNKEAQSPLFIRRERKSKGKNQKTHVTHDVAMAEENLENKRQNTKKNDTKTQLTHVAKNSGKLLRECWKGNPQLK